MMHRLPFPARWAVILLGTITAIFALQAPPTRAAGQAQTYVERGGFDTYLQHPKTLPFSVDGDLIGKNLRWTNSGSPRSTARGVITSVRGTRPIARSTSPERLS